MSVRRRGVAILQEGLFYNRLISRSLGDAIRSAAMHAGTRDRRACRMKIRRLGVRLRARLCRYVRRSRRGPCSLKGARSFSKAPLEQRQDALAVLVGDRERLNAELLLRAAPGAGVNSRVHVGVDQLADTAIHQIHQRLHELRVVGDAVLDCAEVGGGLADRVDRGGDLAM